MRKDVYGIPSHPPADMNIGTSLAP
jgi:hypothetical protein